MTRRIRWLIGVVLVLLLVSMILFYPVPSMLRWQSNFLARSFIIFLICSALCLYRVLRGPTPADRVVAIDILGIMVVGLCAVLSLPTGRDWYIDIGIAWALESFIGTIALAKFLEGKDFDE